MEATETLAPLDPTFEAGGSRYDLSFDYATSVRVRKLLGVNLLRLFTDKDQMTALADPDLLLGVVWYLASGGSASAAELQQLRSGELPEPMLDFLVGFEDADIERATDALLAAAILFFQPDKRPALQRVLAALMRLKQRQLSKLNEVTQSDELEQAIVEAAGAVEKTEPIQSS